MAQKYFLELVLKDEGTSVKALIRDGDKLILDYENEESRQVRVRASLPDRESFIKTSEYWVESGDYENIEECVESYIANMRKNVFDQIQEIRKSIKRINKLMQCISIARDELKKYKHKQKTD